MAKSVPAAIVKLADFGNYEARFGKTDKVVKLPLSRTADNGWKVADIEKDSIVGVLYVGKDGQTFAQDFSRYPENVKAILLFHGTKQKTGDEYADLDTVDDCLEAVRAMDGQLADGKFYSDRQGFAGISVLMRAIMKVYGIAEDAAREFLKPLSAKEKMALRASDELKGAIAEIEAEKGKGADVSGLLGKLKKPNGDPAGNQ